MAYLAEFEHVTKAPGERVEVGLAFLAYVLHFVQEEANAGLEAGLVGIWRMVAVSEVDVVPKGRCYGVPARRIVGGLVQVDVLGERAVLWSEIELLGVSG